MNIELFGNNTREGGGQVALSVPIIAVLLMVLSVVLTIATSGR